MLPVPARLADDITLSRHPPYRSRTHTMSVIIDHSHKQLQKHTFTCNGTGLFSSKLCKCIIFPVGSVPSGAPNLIPLKTGEFNITRCVASARIRIRAFRLIPVVDSDCASTSTCVCVSSVTDPSSIRTLILNVPVPLSFQPPSFEKKYSLARAEKWTSSPSSPVSTVGMVSTWVNQRLAQTHLVVRGNEDPDQHRLARR